MRNNLRALLNHNTPELPSELIERLALQSSPKAHEFRTNAWQQAQNLPFPDKKDEAWRRISLDALLQTPLNLFTACLLYTSPSPRDRTRSRMPSSA
mgnify:CR=1 FL=1